MSGRPLITLVPCACVAVLGLAVDADAKAITITISQTAEIRDSRLVARVTVGNTGDEPARRLVVRLSFGDRRAAGGTHGELAPGASLEEELSVPTGTLGEGCWPYEIAVDYADANLYPFQALLVNAITAGGPPAAKLVVTAIESGGIADSGPVTVRLKNLSQAERDVRLRVVVPEGLEVGAGTGKAHLMPWEETTRAVTVVNRSVLAGSRCPIFVVLEFDDGGVHQCVVSQGLIEVVPPPSVWIRNQTLILLASSLLAVAWLLVVLRRAMSRKAA